MNEEQLMVADKVDRMAVAPVIYDTVVFNFTAAAPSGGLQAITLDSDDYEVFNKGVGEAEDGAGYTASKDPWFTNLYKDGSFSKDDDFLIYGIGVQFTGTPFIATGGVASGSQIVGTLISAADHAENLANLILSQVYITVGADEEDCTALAGPVGLWPFGGMNLGDNAVSPRLMNANMGNDRMFRYALRQPAGSTSKNGISVTFKRSEHMSLTYSTDTTISTGAVAVAYAAHVVAFGRRVSKGGV